MEQTKKKVLTPSILLQGGLILILFVFLIVPLLIILFKIDFVGLKSIFSNEVFYKSIKNSIIYTFISTTIVVILSTICAYFLSRLRIKGKKFLLLFLILPMLIPTISIGLGIRTLFGVNGFLDQFLHIKVDGLGFMDLIIGSVVFAFPVSFLLIYDALLYEDRSVYDAANTLGLTRTKSFFGVTLPYLKTTLISAFFATFTLIFSDYGLPMEVAGKVKTIPMFLYEQAQGLNASNYGKAAVISFALLIPAVIAFVFDVLTKESASGVSNKEHLKPTKLFNIVGIATIVLVGIFLSLPLISFVTISFVTSFPNNMTFSFENYKKAFSPYSSVNITAFLTNSLIISLLSGLVGTVVAYICGYATSRTEGKLKKVLHLISISSLAIPGLVLGLGYVFLFANTTGWFAGTITILVVVNIIHYFSSPYLMAKNAFEKIDRNYETVAETLGISRASMFFKVMIPNTTGTILQMFSYIFINSMITISAVSFLSTYATQPLAVSITTYENQGIWEMEAVISTLILLINVVMKVVFDSLSSSFSKINAKVNALIKR
ncbi:MAG: ABC transporter permease subunit [Bacilli bacterium]|nr:ABC transporter permease subunit [Bacilli bacterium]